MALRREVRQPADVARYRERYPAIDDEALVALIYEEYCLREEAGETPDAAEYLARFPGVADRLREVLEIHGLVAEAPAPPPTLPNRPRRGSSPAGRDRRRLPPCR